MEKPENEQINSEKEKKTHEITESEATKEINQKTLEELLKENPNILNTTTSVKIRNHSGPIPDPETLKAYKSIYKNAPEIIFNMATKEQRFRHMSTFLGQLSAFLIGMSGLGVTAYLGVNDQPWLAGVIGFGSLSSLVGVFLFRNQEK